MFIPRNPRDFILEAKNMEFNVNEQIILPSNIIETHIDSYWVIIAPDYPNWIVLNDIEYAMFYYLKSNTIITTLESFYNETKLAEEKCLSIITDLLQKINDAKFYKNTEINEEDPIETIPKRIHINVTNNCNMRCQHCFMSAGLHPTKELNIDNLLNTIHALENELGIMDIVVSGGEPLMHKDIYKLLKGISKHNVTLFTNASLINESNINIISNSCKEVQVSFEGISKACYEEVRGPFYKKVINALELLKSKHMRIVLAITILPSTIEDISNNLIHFIQSLDYNNLEIRINDEIEMTGNALSMDFSNYDKKIAKHVLIKQLNELISKGLANRVDKERNVRFTNCGIGTNIVINSDGKIYPCNKFSELFYNFESAKTIITEFNNLNRKTSNIFIEKCKSCELKYICAGGCRIDNFIRNGDMMKPICNKEFKLEQYRRLLNDYLEGEFTNEKSQ